MRVGDIWEKSRVFLLLLLKWNINEMFYKVSCVVQILQKLIQEVVLLGIVKENSDGNVYEKNNINAGFSYICSITSI